MTAAAPERSRPSGEHGRAPAGLPSEADVMGRAGTENFTVASRLLPVGARRHLLAIYGYARLVDQLGDDYAGDRLAALDWLTDEVRYAVADPRAPELHPLVGRVATMLAEVGGDPAPLYDLIAANRQDQLVHRYATFDDLVGYCRLSADPVGRLVLMALGRHDRSRVAWSDRICTALQLAEHWQDVAEDAASGRVYLPEEDLDRFGVRPEQLSAAPPAGPELRALMAFEVSRARRILEEGSPLVGSLAGRSRFAIAGFVAGGHAALDAVADADYDPLPGSPWPRPARVVRHLARLLAPKLRDGGRR